MSNIFQVLENESEINNSNIEQTIIQRLDNLENKMNLLIGFISKKAITVSNFL